TGLARIIPVLSWERLSCLSSVILIVRIVAGGDEIDPRMNSWAAVENVLRTKEGSLLLRSLVAAMPRYDSIVC
ncbi:MAG: hypothetical protein ACLQVD_09425, partial [Capsulimonadaceae bacterium]